VIARPGADERKPETAGTEATLTSLGYRIARIEAPGTLDGGDVLKHDRTVWVGLGGRTNAEGLEQLDEAGLNLRVGDLVDQLGGAQVDAQVARAAAP